MEAKIAETIVSDIVGRVLEYAAGSIAERIALYFGGREKLDELRVTMTFIQARLSDAERHHEGQRGDLVNKWLGELKNVMCRLEDLFEEIDVHDRKNKQRWSSSKLSKVVCFLPPKLSSLGMNKKVVEEAENILSELNCLKVIMDTLGLVPREVNVGDCQSRLNQVAARETQPFILEGKVIGRDKDRGAIVDMLFKASSAEEVLSIIPIVGMGGLGKTALAQTVYNDERVQRFFENKYWACISDNISSCQELIGKVLHSMSEDDGRGWHQCGLQELYRKFIAFVNGKMFLLVLDDVWEVDVDWWIELKELLCKCKLGSAVLVTTRSHSMALNMSTVEPCYELKGLSKDQSWALFKSLAFRKGQEESCPNLANIGREIVQKCANSPLAIRTIATLLYSRTTKEEWMQFRDKEIGVMDQNENIKSTLRLSYNHLQSQEKKCFAYCSLYPKDYEFNIRDLIWRWMAQGYVRSMDDGREVFMQLLRRCFFQEVIRDKYDILVGCKMHDLLHDLAESVNDECLRLGKCVENISSNIRHVTVIIDEEDSLSPQEASWMRVSPQIRSFSLPFGSLLDCHVVLHLRQLRVLDLGERPYESVPNSIGKLQQLRYLKANVDCLPDAITTLQKLQVLNVCAEELPRDFHKLASLRHLEICNKKHDCWMPPGIGKLVNLETLSTFVVGPVGLDALAGLNLIGKLRINFYRSRENAISEAKMSNLKGKKLTHLSLWRHYRNNTDPKDDDEVLNGLPVPSALEILEIDGFAGVRRLSWGIHDLPNIVWITISSCKGIQHLPSLCGLPYLKRLTLSKLEALEFIEDASSLEVGAIYFPSLEMLELTCLFNLKRWSRIEVTDTNQQMQQCQQQRHCFPRLLTLSVLFCPKLRTMPLSQFAALNYRMPQMVEDLHICYCNGLDLWVEENNDGNEVDGNSVNLSAWEGLHNIRTLKLNSIERLESLPNGIATMTQLQSLELTHMDDLKALSEECIGQLTQLRSLSISECYLVEALPRSIRGLNALKELYIWECPQLKSRCEKPNGEDWPLIQHIPHVDIRDKYSWMFD